MLKILFVCLLFTSTICYCQTKPIAFKSHSGNSTHYDPSGSGNLGLSEPFIELDSIVKLNDSTVVYFYNRGVNPYNYDTLVNDSFWSGNSINIDSVKKSYYNNVELIGFDEKKSLRSARKKNKRNNISIIPSDSAPKSLTLYLGMALSALVLLLIFASKNKHPLKTV